MQLVGKFNFLKMEKGHTKPNENGEIKEYFVVSLLDDNKEPCKFFVFNADFVNKLSSCNFKLYQELVGTLEVSYYKDNWTVNLRELYEPRNDK